MTAPLEPAVKAERIPVSADARFLLAFTESPADTRAMVRKVREFIEGNPRGWQRCKAGIDAAATNLAAGLKDAPELALDSMRQGAAAMARLGEEAGTPILTEELARICALASSAGAAAKPSGAGGGDCAIVLAFGDEARDRVAAALSPFPVLRISPA